MSHSGTYDKCRVELPTINLFKMHGSISWNKQVINSEEKIVADYELKKIKELKEFIENNQELNIVEQVKSIFEEINQADDITIDQKYTVVNERLNNIVSEDSKIVGEFYKKYKDLLIINPDRNKFYHTVYEQHYYQMIRNFSYELEKENTILFVFGFSFEDQHILEIFKRAIINPKIKVYIITYSKKAHDKIWNKLKEYKNIVYFPTDKDFNQGVEGDYFYFNTFLGDNMDGE